METLDLVKSAIKVAAKCTAQPNPSSVAKTICTDFVPCLIDYVADKRALAKIHADANNKLDGIEPFDPFAPDEVAQAEQAEDDQPKLKP